MESLVKDVRHLSKVTKLAHHVVEVRNQKWPSSALKVILYPYSIWRLWPAALYLVPCLIYGEIERCPARADYKAQVCKRTKLTQ